MRFHTARHLLVRFRHTLGIQSTAIQSRQHPIPIVAHSQSQIGDSPSLDLIVVGAVFIRVGAVYTYGPLFVQLITKYIAT